MVTKKLSPRWINTYTNSLSHIKNPQMFNLARIVLLRTTKRQKHWSTNDKNKEIRQWLDQGTIDQSAKKFAKELRSKGHVCIRYTNTHPVKISWCGLIK